MHAARFGAKFNVQGALARSKHSTRYIGYLTQYLAKQLGDCHHPGSAQRDHGTGSPRRSERYLKRPSSPVPRVHLARMWHDAARRPHDQWEPRSAHLR